MVKSRGKMTIVSFSLKLTLTQFLFTPTALPGDNKSECPACGFSIRQIPQHRSTAVPSSYRNEMPILFPYASQLRKLDLLYVMLDTEDHCQLIQQCANLEILEARYVIGDRDLEVLAQMCKRLKRLRIERGADEPGMEDEQGVVSQRGLSTLAQGCVELEYLAIYVSDITNASLESFGTYLKNLSLVLLDNEERIADLSLDNGVQALLRGCEKLRRFALYPRAGGLTDVGLGYIGQYSHNVRWMLLGYVGESDRGLLEFSRGCPNLQKLEAIFMDSKRRCRRRSSPMPSPLL